MSEKKHWSVSVEVAGDDVLTISSQHMAGKEEMSAAEINCIEQAARDLLGFIDKGAEDLNCPHCLGNGYVHNQVGEYLGECDCVFSLHTRNSIPDAELWKLLPGTARYLDPPDGGSPSLLTQLQRMAKDAHDFWAIPVGEKKPLTDDILFVIDVLKKSTSSGVENAIEWLQGLERDVIARCNAAWGAGHKDGRDLERANSGLCAPHPSAAIRNAALDEQLVIEAFLNRTGQYVTNDASREAALAEARNMALEEAAIECDNIYETWGGAWECSESIRGLKSSLASAKEAPAVVDGLPPLPAGNMYRDDNSGDIETSYSKQDILAYGQECARKAVAGQAVGELTFDQIEDALPEKGIWCEKDGGLKCSAQFLHDFARNIRTLYTAAPAAVAQEPVAVPDGWKLVPAELTEEMHVAAVRTIRNCSGNDDFPPRVYAAMLAAAPTPSVAQAGDTKIAKLALTVHKRIDSLCVAANTAGADYFDASTSMMIATRDLLKELGHPHEFDAAMAKEKP